jgi:hypothetical protein
MHERPLSDEPTYVRVFVRRVSHFNRDIVDVTGSKGNHVVYCCLNLHVETRRGMFPDPLDK